MESFEYWPRLPEELKREVIKNMGFADRYNTRLCASQEMRLVDKLPTHLDNLEFVNLMKHSDNTTSAWRWIKFHSKTLST
ncbi:F-box domain-containing protein [Caenorhabditis elegans]|uniref:F-box domain-containing protein n=1 Tax=Caenorhabditis elegans TaxID=6239 RepID=Q9XX48_CAEEL|nr:F-box domain-containing protein [Caenorhabditis elegans]CAA20991.2 F-box domain-containing protein [Caenorhabditis elegans]|eukprot:NP_507956.2 Uncharacterized protein CELE_Y38H6C.13 [Caenorhabditis elegans]